MMRRFFQIPYFVAYIMTSVQNSMVGGKIMHWPTTQKMARFQKVKCLSTPTTKWFANIVNATWKRMQRAHRFGQFHSFHPPIGPSRNK